MSRRFLVGAVALGMACAQPEPAPTPPVSPTTTAPRGPATGKAPGRPGAAQTTPARPDKHQANATPPTVVVRDGQVYVTGSWVLFGPRNVRPVPHPTPEPTALPSSTDPEDHGDGGSARAAGGPPATRQGTTATTGPVQRWTFQNRTPDAVHVWVDAFWLDRDEVTRAQYAQFLRETGYRPPHVDEAWARDGWNWKDGKPPAATDDHPVVLVSWYDAQEYCAWAGKRLPTEAEWQLAALGPWGQARDYPWGDTFDGATHNHGTIVPPNFDPSDGFETTAPVGSFPTGDSPFGARDMFGNAWEYTADLRVDSASLSTFLHAPTDAHPAGVRNLRSEEPGLYAAVRGGSYFFDLRPNPGGERHRFLTEIRRKTSGFRCARDSEP